MWLAAFRSLPVASQASPWEAQSRAHLALRIQAPRAWSKGCAGRKGQQGKAGRCRACLGAREWEGAKGQIAARPTSATHSAARRRCPRKRAQRPALGQAAAGGPVRTRSAGRANGRPGARAPSVQDSVWPRLQISNARVEGEQGPDCAKECSPYPSFKQGSSWPATAAP